MDAGTILGLIVGYLATITGVFLLYSPVIILFIALLIAGGLLQLLLMPFVLLIRRLRRRPQTDTDTDSSWLLDRREG
jgi:cytochrome c-type biogenesis protein CcmH/NrfF